LQLDKAMTSRGPTDLWWEA